LTEFIITASMITMICLIFQLAKDERKYGIRL